MYSIRTLFTTLILGFIFASCNKDELSVYNQQAVLEREAPMLSAYITEKGWSDSARLDQTSGIWYIIEHPGKGHFNYTDSSSTSGQHLLLNARVLVKYTGKLLNDTVFYQQLSPDTNVTGKGYLSLLPTATAKGELNAWQWIFYPKEVGGILPGGLQKGAKIKIVTPSIWGYKDQSTGLVPANSPLVFEMEVLDIKPPIY